MQRRIQKSDPKKGYFFDVHVPDTDTGSTIYFVGPYGGRRILFKPFLMAMSRKGYRVVYFQPTTKVLDVLHPEWLGRAVSQLKEYIQTDITAHAGSPCSLVGVSLGSYMGLNILPLPPIQKFVVVAGGAPLEELFNSAALFRAHRHKHKKSGGDLSQLDKSWYTFDRQFIQGDFRHLEVLAINSVRDKLITPERRRRFLTAMQVTGAQVHDYAKGGLSHTPQALSANLRTKQIDTFLKS